jgi:CPA2 family monovalent cation:H+ antiporter-2
MSQLPTLIADLALILICAGIMTLLFKKLKQPLVLGYVVAGFLASPHMPFTPSVMDSANIKTWADIGVIFLLFALGLEFSFKSGWFRYHSCLYHYLLYDFVGDRSRYEFRMAPNG